MNLNTKHDKLNLRTWRNG